MLLALVPATVHAQAAPVALDKPASTAAPAANPNAVTAPGLAYYAANPMPVVSQISHTVWGKQFTGFDEDQDCGAEMSDAFGIVPAQPGPWMWRKWQWQNYVPRNDESERPTTAMIYCSPNRSGTSVTFTHLSGADYLDVDSDRIAIAEGESGLNACLGKANRIREVLGRLQPPADEFNYWAQDWAAVYEDRVLNMLFLVTCKDTGDAVFMVAGKGDRAANLKVLKDAWNRL
ncbi:MAG: hypothetical protein ACO1OD_02105 [Croceibacterium sp.]